MKKGKGNIKLHLLFHHLPNLNPMLLLCWSDPTAAVTDYIQLPFLKKGKYCKYLMINIYNSHPCVMNNALSAGI